MALIRFGGGIIEIRGSIAGDTYARNRFGGYSRARTKPINPNSPGQQKIRTAIKQLSQRWKDVLNDTQRAEWEAYADAITMKNKLGEVVLLPGYNHYIRSNVLLGQYGADYVDDGPSVLSLPEGDPTVSFTASEASGISFSFDTGLSWVSENDAYLFTYLGEPQNATRTFFGGPWRILKVIPGNAGSPPTSPYPITDRPFLYAQGQRIWLYCRILRADGRISEEFRPASKVVTA